MIPYIVFSHMSLNLDTLQVISVPIILLCVLSGEASNTNVIVFDLSHSEIETIL